MDTVPQSSSSSSAYAQPGLRRSNSFIPLDILPERFQNYQFVPQGFVRGERDGVPGFVRDTDEMFLPRVNTAPMEAMYIPPGHPAFTNPEPSPFMGNSVFPPNQSIFGQPSSSQSQPAQGQTTVPSQYGQQPFYQMPPPQANQFPSFHRGFGPNKIKVPIFGNKVEDWNSFKSKCLLYKTQMSMNGHEHLAGINILSNLTG